MLQQDEAKDYVIGTGESRSVREFVEHAFAYVGIELEWKGEGMEEKGVIRSLSTSISSDLQVGDVIVEIDPRYFRPTEVDFLLADPSKAEKELGWKPKVTFADLVKVMVDADMELSGITPSGEGLKVLQEKGIGWTTNRLTLG